MPTSRQPTFEHIARDLPSRPRPRAQPPSRPALSPDGPARSVVAGEPGHGTRVASLAARVARRTGAVDPKVAYRAGLLHDVGKVLLAFDPTLIFRELTSGERTVVEMHPSLGAALLARAGEPPAVIEGVLHHHERLDGTGYPDGLRGTEIPLVAQVIGVVDVYDALSSPRSYKTAWSRSTVVRYGIERRGRSFHTEMWDAVIAETCRPRRPALAIRR